MVTLDSPLWPMRSNSVPPKWSKRWTDIPRAADRVGAYSTEQLEQMNREFTAAVARAFRAGGESEMAATATYRVSVPAEDFAGSHRALHRRAHTARRHCLPVPAAAPR
jgi:hypothetical protein